MPIFPALLVLLGHVLVTAWPYLCLSKRASEVSSRDQFAPKPLEGGDTLPAPISWGCYKWWQAGWLNTAEACSFVFLEAVSAPRRLRAHPCFSQASVVPGSPWAPWALQLPCTQSLPTLLTHGPCPSVGLGPSFFRTLVMGLGLILVQHLVLLLAIASAKTCFHVRLHSQRPGVGLKHFQLIAEGVMTAIDWEVSLCWQKMTAVKPAVLGDRGGETAHFMHTVFTDQESDVRL